MALINKLNAIGDAIRNKTGKSDLLTLEQMPIEIEAIETGGGAAELPEEVFKITGDCSYRFSNGGWDWFLKDYKNKITTEKITDAARMFAVSHIEEIPFDLNFEHTTYKSMDYLFYMATELKEIKGKIRNAYPSNLNNLFYYCRNLRELPEFENLNLSRIHSYRTASVGSMFNDCFSLRKIPEELLKELYNPLATSSVYICFNGISNCYVLDEIRGLNPQTGTLTSNAFGTAFYHCHRLKEIIFATQEDGTPYSVNWKNQTIDLGSSATVGYGGISFFNNEPNAVSSDCTRFNSGITIDKVVYDDATYAALKDDPDWTAGKAEYSRYNHDSAVNTINSLPSTSNTGCTIKFYGYSGTNTDGGAISNLTEEEIAVAAAKGWTVTIA